MWPLRYIWVKTSLFVLVLLVVTIAASYLIIAHMMRERILNEVVKRGESLSRSIAASAAYSFINQDILGSYNAVGANGPPHLCRCENHAGAQKLHRSGKNLLFSPE